MRILLLDMGEIIPGAGAGLQADPIGNRMNR
jgi:hypothetical protein